MKKFTFLLTALLCAAMSFAGTDYSAVYTSNVTLKAGNNGSTVKVKNGTSTYDGIKLGTGSATGTMTVTVPKDNNVLYLHAAGWNNTTCTLSITTDAEGVTVTPASWSLTANAGIKNSSPFTFSGEVTAEYFCKVKIDGNTAGATITLSSKVKSAGRCVVWGVNADIEAEVVATAVSKATASIQQYKRDTLTATITPAEATTPIVWSSSDENIATVANGVVTAKAIGTAKIYATAGTVKDSCAVTVTAATPITVAQAVEIAKTVSANNEIAAGGMYVIRGYVTKQYGTPSSDMSKYGNYSVWLADTKDGGEVFEAYQVVPTDGETIVEVGDYVEVIADITKYNTIYETVGKTGTISIINKATYTITPLANDANMGNVKGYGVYTRGETATIYAVAYNGFEFVNWTDADNKEVSTNTDYSFTVTGDVTYTANFKALTFIVLTYVNDETMGSVEGAPEDNVAYGTEITLTAKPNTGYKFVNWTNADTEEEVSKEATYTFKVKEDIMLQANFIKDTSTAIDATESAKTAVKTLENGVLYILRDGIRYNAQGVVVE